MLFKGKEQSYKALIPRKVQIRQNRISMILETQDSAEVTGIISQRYLQQVEVQTHAIAHGTSSESCPEAPEVQGQGKGNK